MVKWYCTPSILRISGEKLTTFWNKIALYLVVCSIICFFFKFAIEVRYVIHFERFLTTLRVSFLCFEAGIFAHPIQSHRQRRHGISDDVECGLLSASKEVGRACKWRVIGKGPSIQRVCLSSSYRVFWKALEEFRLITCSRISEIMHCISPVTNCVVLGRPVRKAPPVPGKPPIRMGPVGMELELWRSTEAYLFFFRFFLQQSIEK